MCTAIHSAQSAPIFQNTLHGKWGLLSGSHDSHSLEIFSGEYYIVHQQLYMWICLPNPDVVVVLTTTLIRCVVIMNRYNSV